MLSWTFEIEAAMRTLLGLVLFFSSLSSFSCPPRLSAGSPEVTPPKVTEIEEFLNRVVDLTCDVRGLPAPTVTWRSSDGKV